MKVHYLEIVTPDVESVCATHCRLHGVRFGEPVAALGNARVADLDGGGSMGVRAPMHESELPVVRPYFLVADLEAAIKEAAAAGAELAHPALALPDLGSFAIFIQGGVHYGLWQV